MTKERIAITRGGSGIAGKASVVKGRLTGKAERGVEVSLAA